MKKLLCMFLMLTMLLSLAACAVKEAEPASDSNAIHAGDTTPAVNRDDSIRPAVEEPSKESVTGAPTDPVTEAPLSTTAAAMTTYAATFSPEYEFAYEEAAKASLSSLYSKCRPKAPKRRAIRR